MSNVKIKNGSMVQVVTKEIGKSTPAAYLKVLGKSVTSNKLKAMVAAGIHCNMEITAPKVKRILSTLEAFDIRSERMAEYYIKGGFATIKSQMTEAEVVKVGLSRLMKWSTKLLKEEATGSHGIIEAKIREYEADQIAKKESKDAKADEEKAARKQATSTQEDLLNEEFDDGDELTNTRVFAHITVYFADISHMVNKVLGTNASSAMTKLKSIINKEFTAIEKADKAKAEEANKDAEAKLNIRTG